VIRDRQDFHHRPSLLLAQLLALAQVIVAANGARSRTVAANCGFPRKWSVGLAAHQLGLHGVIAPAATGLGLTLALFEHNLPAEQ